MELSSLLLRPLALLAVLTCLSLPAGFPWTAMAADGAAESGQPAEVDPRRITPVVEVFQSTRQAVVNISSTQIVEVRSPFGGMQGLDELFGLPDAGPRRRLERTSVGSGVLVHQTGYVVTNAHVVARTAERRVIFGDGAEYDAEIVALDETHDLAVLKIDAPDRDLVPITLGRSDDLLVGETVIAIGNPLGYEHTVTAGVVSALDRTLPVNADVSFEGLIQTDASINPGNSGGPLLNILGELVGINTAIRPDAQNIGFAIPVDQLRRLLPEMLDIERRYRVRTGLRVEDDRDAARVAAVDPGSPADRAGLQTGDRIVAVNDTPVRSALEFHIAMTDFQAGDMVNLVLDSQAHLRLVLAERPRPDGEQLLRERLGIEAAVVTPQHARRVGVPTLRGLVVTDIERDSPADRIQLRPGDILIQLGQHQFTDLDDAGELLEQLEAGQRVPLTVLRLGRSVIQRLTAPIRVR